MVMNMMECGLSVKRMATVFIPLQMGVNTTEIEKTMCDMVLEHSPTKMKKHIQGNGLKANKMVKVIRIKVFK
jgi:hypothetical protein